MDSNGRMSFVDTSLDARAVLAQILTFVSDGILVIGPDTHLRIVNAYAETLLGVSARDAIGKPIDGLFVLEDESGNQPVPGSYPWETVLREKKPFARARFSIVKADKGKIPVLLSISPIIGETQTEVDGVIIAIEDRTTEAEVERMKTQFIPFAAHQLRTPLASIRWNTEMLLSGKLGVIPRHFLDTVMSIYDSTQQVIRLVNDLLSLSRIDEGKIPNDPVDVQVGPVIRSVMREMQTMMEKRALHLDMTMPDNLPLLHLDAGRFRDAIQNIVSNAVKFNKPGGTVTISVTSDDRFVEVRVADSGMGIPAVEQKRLFEKFFRAGNAIANQTEGSGLGLYVIKYYMDQWGGAITIESEENKGTTVRLKFPRVANVS